jgi:hypothetical protein
MVIGQIRLGKRKNGKIFVLLVIVFACVEVVTRSGAFFFTIQRKNSLFSRGQLKFFNEDKIIFQQIIYIFEDATDLF